MEKQLTSKLVLIKNRFFGRTFFQKRKRHQITIGIGGNIGNVTRRFNHLIFYLMKDSYLSLHCSSPIVKNPPFGFTKQDDFYNAILLISSKLAPNSLLRHLLNIEKKFARKRSFRNAPRTLDIDIIFYDNLTLNHTKLTLPHVAWHKRESVLVPLSYLNQFH